MRLIPVLDILSGVTVRAVAGRRAEYRPLVSQWTTSTEPCEVAEAIRRQFAWSEFYLADLDAIAGAEPAWELFTNLHRRDFRLWVDAGIRTAADAIRLAACGVAVVVAGLETLQGPSELRAMITELDGNRVAFSLDMMGGRLLGNAKEWGDDPVAIAAKAVECGARRIILLDLSRVGTGRGTGTQTLLTELAEQHPNIEWVVGGGVSGAADLEKLQRAAFVLVASALHDGRLSPDDYGFQTQVAD